MLPFDGIVDVVGYEVGVVCEDRMQGMLQMENWVADGRELLQLVRLYYCIAGNFDKQWIGMLRHTIVCINTDDWLFQNYTIVIWAKIPLNTVSINFY